MNEPGTDFVYSGGGVIVSQMIVMDITHKPYEEYMQKNVLNPLGMKSSFFNQPPLKKKKNLLATGYKASGEEVSGKYHIYPEQAAAGLWTNPVDLSRYIIETQLSYQGKSSKVLTPEMTKLRITSVFKDAALGVFVNTNGSPKYFMHQGGNKGFSCQYVGSFAGGEGMVVMTNSDNGAILDEIVNSVASVYNWKDYYKPVIKKVIELPEILLDKYAGKYELEGTQVTLTRRNKELTISFSSGIFWKVQFTSNVDFFIREYRVDLRFVSDQQGNVTGFTIDGTMVKKIE
jgi:CubicO group peptidase (beta-lactamase class C family)